MHPFLMEELTKAHIAALHDAAEEFRRGGPVRRLRRRRKARGQAPPAPVRIGAPAGSRG
ncbi:MAG TPA: hypothetical protein VF053_21785 [Streptosporangiales bacterium]